MHLLPAGTKPYYETDILPEDILGDHYSLFVRHWKTWKRCNGMHDSMANSFSLEERELIGALYAQLLAHGILVRGVTDKDKVEWLFITTPSKRHTKVSP